jgi:hypothetical protein
MKKNKNKYPVYRITVDEKLSDNLIRLEICRLIKYDETREFKDDPEFWEDITNEGEEILVCPPGQENETQKNLYTEVMNIPQSLVDEFPWKDLKEGQVFLSGAFIAKELPILTKKVYQYYYSPEDKGFKQIDDDVKAKTKTLYYSVLAKGREK